MRCIKRAVTMTGFDPYAVMIRSACAFDGISPTLDFGRKHIHEAARPGDTLMLSMTPVDLKPSHCKPDRGLLTLAGELQTQTGKTVLKFRSLMLIYRRSLGLQNANPC